LENHGMKAQRRGRNTALAGACVEGVCALAMLALASWTGAESARSAAYFLAGGTALWLVAALLLYCRQLEAQEAVELAELAGQQGEGSIFAQSAESAARPAAARRRFVDRRVVPIFALVWALYLAGTSLLMLRSLEALRRGTMPPVAAIGAGAMLTVLIGFVAFLFSRYATGMSAAAEWRPLRAGAAWLLAGAAGIGAAAVALGAAAWGHRSVDLAAAYVLPAAQMVLAVEALVSVVLDVYRPRVPGQEDRLSFDSRLLGLLAEPGRAGHSIAETLNYQFGFQVSRSWFYRLVSKAAVPLAAFGVAVLVAMSSLVIVHQGSRCVVLRWGRRNDAALLGPGLHVKWPWPVETAEQFDVGELREAMLGVGEQREPVVVNGREIQLWTMSHGRYQELDFVVAIPSHGAGAAAPDGAAQGADPNAGAAGGGEEAAKPPPVNLIKLVVSVQYQVADVDKFGYRFTDAAKLLECAACREMVRYCASATLADEIPGAAADRPQAIMTSGWAKAAAALGQRIGRAVGPDGLDLGVQIVRVTITAVHPPPEAAPAFEEVLAAERARDQLRYEATGEADRTLSAVAGEPVGALELATAIKELEALENLTGLSADAAAFARDRDGYVRSLEESLRMLRDEMRREALLGRPEASGGGKAHLAAECRRQIAFLRKLSGPADAALRAELDRARRRADELLARASGAPAAELAAAAAYRWGREMDERARAEGFQKELLAWQASPHLYRLDRWLEVWDEALPKMRKYVLGVDRRKVELWLNWEQGPGGRMEGAFESAEPK